MTDVGESGPVDGDVLATQVKRYRLSDVDLLPDMGMGFERRVVAGDQLMLLEARPPAGTHVATHSHPQEQLSYVISGRIRLLFESSGEEIVLGPGEIAVIPGDMPHGVEILEDTVGFDLFAPPRPEVSGS